MSKWLTFNNEKINKNFIVNYGYIELSYSTSDDRCIDFEIYIRTINDRLIAMRCDLEKKNLELQRLDIELNGK